MEAEAVKTLLESESRTAEERGTYTNSITKVSLKR
jgi:hypothetical protein